MTPSTQCPKCGSNVFQLQDLGLLCVYDIATTYLAGRSIIAVQGNKLVLDNDTHIFYDDVFDFRVNDRKMLPAELLGCSFVLAYPNSTYPPLSTLLTSH